MQICMMKQTLRGSGDRDFVTGRNQLSESVATQSNQVWIYEREEHVLRT